MAKLVIDGGHRLSGEIPVYGSKNAALPLIVATLLTHDQVSLANIPEISDVKTIVKLMESLGVKALGKGTSWTFEAKEVSSQGMNSDLVSQLRGSVLLLGALLGRFKEAVLPQPGGDIIGARPIDVHLDALRQLGADIKYDKGIIHIDGSTMQAGVVTLQEASVTATENVMMVAASLTGTTTIHIAAQEPHVAALGDFLSMMGARITGEGSHTISITGTNHLSGGHFINIPDMLEAGLFILMGAVAASQLKVTNVPLDYMSLFIKKLDDIGINYSISGTDMIIKPAQLKAFKVQTLPYPGIATDLQAPFSVIATQASGTSLIHDPMYESRFRHCDELVKMGASVTVCDPHRVVIEGPTPLHSQYINSLDIRSGATLVLAGLIAEGETTINDAEIIERGYSNLVERLQNIGATIERIE